MRAFFMAAGVGSRLIKDSKVELPPKSTLKIGHDTIIGHTVRMMDSHGIKPYVIDGYRYDVLEWVLSEFHTVNFFRNPFFRVTNSIGSLWIARSAIAEAAKTGEDVIMANADVFWGEDILDRLLSCDAPAVMLGDKTRCEDGDYFFHLDDGKITEYGKEMTSDRRSCEYVGIAKIKNNAIPMFLEALEKLIWDECYNMWWEDVLYRSCDKHPIDVIDVDGAFWAEVDYAEDYHRILNHLGLPNVESMFK